MGIRAGILCVLAVSALGAFASGCGYTLQTSRSTLAEKEGIRRIFVAPLINNTYSPGIENVVYNSLVKNLEVHRRVVLVGSPDAADAVLTGKVMIAQYDPAAEVPAQQLLPSNSLSTADTRANILIATEYNATLSCSFALTRPHPGPTQKSIVWTADFTRSGLFSGNNQLGIQGDTSSLINQSEYEREMLSMSDSMAADLHESMLAMF
jgi:hypothetical protein